MSYSVTLDIVYCLIVTLSPVCFLLPSIHLSIRYNEAIWPSSHCETYWCVHRTSNMDCHGIGKLWRGKWYENLERVASSLLFWKIKVKKSLRWMRVKTWNWHLIVYRIECLQSGRQNIEVYVLFMTRQISWNYLQYRPCIVLIFFNIYDYFVLGLTPSIDV